MSDSNGNGSEYQKRSLQDIMSGDLFASAKGELVETLRFMEGHGTPLHPLQMQGIALLKYIQANRGHKTFDPIINTILYQSKNLTPPGTFIEVINSYFTGNLIDKRMVNNALKGGK
ncbi:hypothetical protein CEB3_c17560 [Peptococcaceae bacterium CEB3]|nr:hypothetical protein CEB3_c17560 [Peptococcaceae bacterium CEB3]